ncbi:MAG: hypothetical protein AABM66_12145 [Actinomycetota bacterium]
MGLAIDLPFSDAPWEPVAQVDVAAVVADLEAKAALDNATADQLQAELAELRRQREPVELTPPARTPTETHWIETGEPWRAGSNVIDLSEPVGEEEPLPGVIELANPSPEVCDEVNEAKALAERWTKEWSQ